MSLDDFCDAVADARRAGIQTSVETPEPVLTVESAMEIQKRIFEEFGSPSVGWKIGAVNEAAQSAMGLQHPFYGPIAACGLFGSGTDMAKTECVAAVEPEYAFKLARDFPATGETIDRNSVVDAIGSVHLVIEVIGRCLANPQMTAGISTTLDFAGNAGFIVGDEITNWTEDELRNQPVSVSINGEVLQTGSGAAVLDSPVNSLIWLAESLSSRGEQLKAGEWVSTGTCTPAVPVESGSSVIAEFDGFGEVTVNFV